MAKKDYITLKEAAELTGYASDYIGQLIRKGKIEGKQVYYNVAWVTTEAAIQQYLEHGAKGSNTVLTQASNKLNIFKHSFFQKLQAHKAFKVLLYSIIALSVAVFLFLFYILSVNINEKIEQRAQESIHEQTLIHSLEQNPVYDTL